MGRETWRVTVHGAIKSWTCVYATERTHAYTGRDTMDNIIIAKKEKQQTVNQDFDTQQKQLSNMKANPSLLLLRM